MLSSSKPKVLLVIFIFGIFVSGISSQAENSVGEAKSSFGNSAPYRQLYSSSYTNPSQQNPGASSRDSYANAASDLGYNAPVGNDPDQHTHQPSMMYHVEMQPMKYHPSPMQGYQPSPMQGYGAPSPAYGEDIEDGKGGGGIGGEIGLLGLLGLKGVKAVKALKAAVVLAPVIAPLFLPILLLAAPILLLLAALPILAILFIPIPVVTIPGRSNSQFVETARTTLEASMKQDCAERITCEISKAAKLYGYDPPWMTSFMEKSSTKSKVMAKVSRAFKSSDCKVYECDIVTSLKERLKIN